MPCDDKVTQLHMLRPKAATEYEASAQGAPLGGRVRLPQVIGESPINRP
jgi:hypothetical protein